MTSSIRFRAARNPFGVLLVTPEIDGAPLTMLAANFEAKRGYEAAGGYGGLIGENEYNADPVSYYLGEGGPDQRKPRRVWLLACDDCGDAECWPLEARIVADAETVVWSEFSQPRRPARDYARFGPFVFARLEYDEALREVVDDLGA